MKLIFFQLLLTLTGLVHGQAKDAHQVFSWPGHATLAVSLSYDDALASQLDHAVPALNRLGLRGSFYILPSSLVFRQRMEEWRTLANQGHELGNHSIFHPCRASLAGREWVASHRDLDHYSVEQMREELATANTILFAIDGKTERTLTPPCGDRLAGGEDYLATVSDLFVAIKPLTEIPDFSVTWSPNGVTGAELIEYVRQMEGRTRLVNILFHGVGGDYLSVEENAHEELLEFLAENRDRYWVDSFIKIMEHVDGLATRIPSELEK
jgi:peptidoglycan/xylan/chitin deacetylase (PgdA/CDA1 family)